jgi:hypothetical protein
VDSFFFIFVPVENDLFHPHPLLKLFFLIFLDFFPFSTFPHPLRQTSILTSSPPFGSGERKEPNYEILLRKSTAAIRHWRGGPGSLPEKLHSRLRRHPD